MLTEDRVRPKGGVNDERTLVKSASFYTHGGVQPYHCEESEAIVPAKSYCMVGSASMRSSVIHGAKYIAPDPFGNDSNLRKNLQYDQVPQGRDVTTRELINFETVFHCCGEVRSRKEGNPSCIMQRGLILNHLDGMSRCSLASCSPECWVWISSED